MLPPAACPSLGKGLLPASVNSRVPEMVKCYPVRGGQQGYNPQINPGDLDDGEWGPQGVLEPPLPMAMFWAEQERGAQGV